MTGKGWTAAGLLLAGLLAAGQAQAELIRGTGFKSGNWSGGAYTNDRTGNFSHCAASVNYRSGITLVFSVTEKFEWGMGLASESWNLTPGGSAEVSYSVDGGPRRNAKAEIATDKLVKVWLPDSSDLFDEFRYGSRLVVVTPRERLEFALTGTARMLASLLVCVNENKDSGRATSGGSNPFGGAVTARPAEKPAAPAPAPVPASDGATPQDRAEAAIFVANLLAQASFKGSEIMQPEKAPGPMQKHAAVFRTGDALGSVRILAGNADSNDVKASLMATDARECKGRFASGVLPSDNNQGIEVFTACDGENGWTAYYTTVPRGQGGIYLISLLGRPANGDTVKQQGAALREAAARSAR